MKKLYKFQNDLIDYFIKSDYTYNQIYNHLLSVINIPINKKEILTSDKIVGYLRTKKLKKICLKLKK